MIMRFTDLLTISMPVYERKDFFRMALESALNQTVKCKVIVVDNCSSHDYFEKVCREKNVPYYRNDYNLGMARNFARVFELADSKFNRHQELKVELGDLKKAFTGNSISGSTILKYVAKDGNIPEEFANIDATQTYNINSPENANMHHILAL